MDQLQLNSKYDSLHHPDGNLPMNPGIHTMLQGTFVGHSMLTLAKLAAFGRHL